MPRYNYMCESCKEEFVLIHSMNELKKNCHLCGVKESLKKIPSLTLKSVKTVKEKKVGDIVKEYITTVKKEVKEEKESLSNRRQE